MRRVNEFARQLRIRRERHHGHTQEVAAPILGVEQARFSEWERGTGFPRRAIWPDVARYMGMSTKQFTEWLDRLKDEQRQSHGSTAERLEDVEDDVAVVKQSVTEIRQELDDIRRTLMRLTGRSNQEH